MGLGHAESLLTYTSSEVSVELVVFHELKRTDIVAILSSYRQ
jgi:hypothetical protein